jgi:hypothetical protein
VRDSQRLLSLSDSELLRVFLSLIVAQFPPNVHKDSNAYDISKCGGTARPSKSVWRTGEMIAKKLKLDLVSPVSPALSSSSSKPSTVLFS